jgi:cell division protein FtsB
MIASYASLGTHRRRRRREGYRVVFRFLLGLAAVAAVGGYGYQVGVSASQAWTEKLEADLQRLQDDNLRLRDELAQAALGASSARTALEELERRYAAEVPDGELAELLERVDRQLHAGVEPARLAFLIDAAGQDAGCVDAPVTKRFRPRTPISTGAVSAVRFGDRITVTAAAESALDPDGQPEAWYDPARPVQLVFRTLDGRELQVEGVLPLAHRMLVDGQEYRFSAIAGPTSFVEITGQACPFP